MDDGGAGARLDRLSQHSRWRETLITHIKRSHAHGAGPASVHQGPSTTHAAAMADMHGQKRLHYAVCRLRMQDGKATIAMGAAGAVGAKHESRRGRLGRNSCGARRSASEASATVSTVQ